MTRYAKRLAAVLGTAAITFGLTLSILWPKETQADDPETALVDDDVPLDTTKAGTLAMKSRLVRDDAIKGRWYLEMEIRNNDPRGMQTAELEGRVLARRPGSEASRVPAMPQVVFKCNEKVEIAAGETVVRRRVLPDALAKKVASRYDTAVVQTGKQPAMRSGERYMTAVFEVEKAPAPPLQRTRS